MSESVSSISKPNSGGRYNNKKERSICCHCSSVADKCYKLHEYPPG